MGRPRIIEVALPGKLTGITFYPFIFVEYLDPYLINHEAIHYKQQKELFVIGFYLWYLWEWIRHGYKKNMFEIEAYTHQRNLNYLKTREKYAFFRRNR
jgi:hypothetical protein